VFRCGTWWIRRGLTDLYARILGQELPSPSSIWCHLALREFHHHSLWSSFPHPCLGSLCLHPMLFSSILSQTLGRGLLHLSSVYPPSRVLTDGLDPAHRHKDQGTSMELRGQAQHVTHTPRPRWQKDPGPRLTGDMLGLSTASDVGFEHGRPQA
jgi:hypothetical protein